MNILLINNYDSFIYNLYHLVKQVVADAAIDVVYNDEITVEKAAAYDRIIISPGPGIPSEAGLVKAVIHRLAPSVPILGVCLGHQAIAEEFGAAVCCMDQPLHGIKSTAQILNHSGIFRDLPAKISVGRYHSWSVSKERFPASLQVTAVDDAGTIMALSHNKYNLHGVQFHPESIMTPLGVKIVANFL